MWRDSVTLRALLSNLDCGAFAVSQQVQPTLNVSCSPLICCWGYECSMLSELGHQISPIEIGPMFFSCAYFRFVVILVWFHRLLWIFRGLAVATALLSSWYLAMENNSSHLVLFAPGCSIRSKFPNGPVPYYSFRGREYYWGYQFQTLRVLLTTRASSTFGML